MFDLADLLRAEGRHAVGAASAPLANLALAIAGGGAVFGAAIGSWSGSTLQIFFSALKIPLLLAVSTIVVLPSFYVVNALLGLAGDFRRALAGILSAQAGFALVLMSLAPVVVFANRSVASYEAAKFACGAAFVAASVAAQHLLLAHYLPLIARAPRHRTALALWPVLYLFVAAQLGHTLRPFLGAPYLRVQFLRDDAWQNVYVELVWLIVGTFGGM